MAPLVTTRRYDPVSGAIVDSMATSISLGLLPPFTKSKIIVIDAFLSGFQAAGNIGFGIASAEFGGSEVSGVLRYDVVSSPVGVLEPTRVVSGVSGQSGGSNVFDVGFRDVMTSRYVVLMALAPERPIANGCFTVKWFFGYALEE